jgi:hypothetical protein
VQQWLDVQQQTFFGRDIMKLPKWWQWYTEVQGEYVEKQVSLLGGGGGGGGIKIKFFLKKGFLY